MNPAGLFLIAMAIITVVTTIAGNALSYAHKVASTQKAAIAARTDLLAVDWLRANWSPTLQSGSENLPIPVNSQPVPLCTNYVAACNSQVVFSYVATNGSSATTSPAGVPNPNVQTDNRIGELYLDSTIGMTFVDASGKATGAKRTVGMKLRVYLHGPWVTLDGGRGSGEAANVTQGKASGCNGIGCGDDTRLHAYTKCVDTALVLCAQRFNEVGSFVNTPYASTAANAPVAAR